MFLYKLYIIQYKINGLRYSILIRARNVDKALLKAQRKIHRIFGATAEIFQVDEVE